MLYQNVDGTIDYQQMICDVDAAIVSGAINLMETLDPKGHKRAALGIRMYHPYKQALDQTRLKLMEWQGLRNPSQVEEEDSHVDVAWDHVPYEYDAAD